ncbi:DNA-directed RNA polymerase subunit delta [Listeria seeligeri]|uniref:Probable DNA-directed RNA polymerase subunit delta n=2 Tax=Listeria seeligeri TaxID=1640 RepID=A0A7X1C682_LISSE|nr:DNA-directed RNA polymerase subunit delta [Listeria seeligeri]EFS02061.1 DNA-directed RNA polymerase, delta subunit [Listeria seeligeri FSL S4-171]EFR99035.1 DNA-directed RNA polymerase, delta subunit [Listeria seeligeri FSL N1-067]KKD49195.1 DNA-directed RNA polymerase subunit delta [Listeria seeligeri]MBC1485941.1 DNA-directed RNA polymerase subunit delta [Listeria seeligeri]MBC1578489.1 DNA-directed RNA polymerase subunit delta [Listeria seeligeri]
MDLKNLTQEERSELSLIDVAHFILEQRKETILFPELVKEIQTFLGLKDAEIRERLVQFYTDMNIDGNFISLGNNTWGLRAWYPMDAIDEEVQTQTTPKKKRKSDDDDEDEEILDDDVDYDDEEVVEELGEEEITLADVLLDEDEDDDDHLPDGIEGDLATVEDDYTDGDYTEDPEDK